MSAAQCPSRSAAAAARPAARRRWSSAGRGRSYSGRKDWCRRLKGTEAGRGKRLPDLRARRFPATRSRSAPPLMRRAPPRTNRARRGRRGRAPQSVPRAFRAPTRQHPRRASHDRPQLRTARSRGGRRARLPAHTPTLPRLARRPEQSWKVAGPRLFFCRRLSHSCFRCLGKAVRTQCFFRSHGRGLFCPVCSPGESKVCRRLQCQACPHRNSALGLFAR
jgi:hypothetical protein